MPGRSLTVVVPDCAARCPFVASLLRERARDHHTSEEHERVMHGLPGEDHRPVDPDLIPRELRAPAPAHHPI